MTTRTLTRFAKRDDGQALIEFALITPFLLLFLVAIIEFGRAWNEHQVLTDAVREGARQAAIYDDAGVVTQDSIEHVIKRVLFSNNMEPDSANITLTNWNGGSGTPLTVSVQYPYRFIFFGELASWALNTRKVMLNSSFTMRNE
ncbi:MAG TPA: TadE family protein [Gemmatimonadales bacterium]|nr:TadE family protein [Gemmatimonadales bacterium]